MADTLRLEIVTPEAVAYAQDVQMVTLPAVDGQIGILPHHVPVLTRVVPGEIIVQKDGQQEFIAVGAGVVEITGEQVAIVTDMAVAAKDIDEARAEEARQRAAETRAQAATREAAVRDPEQRLLAHWFPNRELTHLKSVPEPVQGATPEQYLKEQLEKFPTLRSIRVCKGEFVFNLKRGTK
jgi:F-type H+-transporting ATPase subunit epsilon